MPKRGRTKYFWCIITTVVAVYIAYPNVGELNILLSVMHTHTGKNSQNSPEELTGQRAGLGPFSK